jgi:hypothetical protein
MTVTIPNLPGFAVLTNMGLQRPPKHQHLLQDLEDVSQPYRSLETSSVRIKLPIGMAVD